MQDDGTTPSPITTIIPSKPYTAQEVADYLRISMFKMYEMLDKGEKREKGGIVGFRIGKSWRITGENLLAYMKENSGTETS